MNTWWLITCVQLAGTCYTAASLLNPCWVYPWCCEHSLTCLNDVKQTHQKKKKEKEKDMTEWPRHPKKTADDALCFY